ncbi:MAG: limonene-1,2-epoxide hydrolase [Acidimicrobiaceae bacterium]|nr:limonene-1,2-epoxide hydrolase [Acidimicrobiaceae bacterium]MEC7845199.1 limonene-1,2-epoxide hydrolase family protein [Actinomycetota bacterium]MED5230634.1 limonene-1,2-epoxide hydrolase family protein [Actinomycetota bacterium]
MIKPAEIIETFFKALSSRDLEKILSFFDHRSTWQNVPHPPANGVEEISEMFRTIVERSSKIQWDIVTAAFDDDRAWIERVDRFWIDEVEYAVRCHGVFDFDTKNSTIVSVRDYVDLGEWRERLGGANL